MNSGTFFTTFTNFMWSTPYPIPCTCSEPVNKAGLRPGLGRSFVYPKGSQGLDRRVKPQEGKTISVAWAPMNSATGARAFR